MTKYRVRIPEVHIVTIEVEAEGVEHARLKASELLEEGLDDLSPEYSHTHDIWHWGVEELRGCD